MRISVIVGAALIWSCTVVPPPGWPAEESEVEAQVVEATPGVMYGFAPWSWDLPDGRRIRLDVDRCVVHQFGAVTRSNIEFTASFPQEQDSPVVRCRTNPSGTGVPQTRFGCTTADEQGRPVDFWMAPGEGCEGYGPDTLTRTACWDGEVTGGEAPIALVHGYLESTGTPVGQVSWVSREGPLLAASIVNEMQIRLYTGRGQLRPELRDRLLLFTVALSFWEHASQPD